MSIPLDISDKAGQGKLWETIRALSNDYMDATNRGDKHTAAYLERRLADARKEFHRLHGKKV